MGMTVTGRDFECIATGRRTALLTSTGVRWLWERSTIARSLVIVFLCCVGLTPGVGKYDADRDRYSHKLFIRELCVATGALGCALWDGGVILARWIYDNPSRSPTSIIS